MRLLLAACVAVVTAQDSGAIVPLMSQYRTATSVGNLDQTQYFTLQVCEEDDRWGDNGILSLSIIIPGNAAYANGTWDAEHGLVNVQVANKVSFEDSSIVAANYNGKNYRPFNHIRVPFNKTTFDNGQIYIRAKAFRSQTRVVLGVQYQYSDENNQATHWALDRNDNGWKPWDSNTEVYQMVQYVQTTTPRGVYGQDFIYFNVKFCANGLDSARYLTAAAIGLPGRQSLNGGGHIPSQSIFNIILCKKPSGGLPLSIGCSNSGSPLTIKANLAASPVVTIPAFPLTSFDYRDFIIAVQGQGGYRADIDGRPAPYSQGRNDFTLSITVS